MSQKRSIQKIITKGLKNIPFHGIVPYGGALDPDLLVAILEEVPRKDLVDLYVLQFLLNEIFAQILRVRIKPDGTETTGKLTLTQLNKIGEVAEETLLGLPIQYQMYLPLSDTESHLETIALHPNIKIKTITDKELKRLRPHGTVDNLIDILSRVDQAPRLINLNRVMMVVSTEGYVGKYGHIKTKGSDPLLYMKIYTALLDIKRCYKQTPLNQSDRSRAMYIPTDYQYYAYRDDQHIRNIEETADDYRYIASRRIQNTTEKKRFEEVNQIFNSLITKNPKAATAKEKYRKNLINALFWYYQASKTREPHVQALYITSVVDAFREDKNSKFTPRAKMISETITSDINNEEFVLARLSAVYKRRNKFAHGSDTLRSLEKFNQTGTYEQLENDTVLTMLGIYIVTRISRYLKS